ncbi:MAG: hypothetical protein ACI9MC_004139, partial [Kiritimatiellia bacterium]
VRVEGFVSHTRPERVMATHVALLMVTGVAGVWFPGWAVMVGAVLTASLLGEATGRFALLRRLLLKSASYNLVARDNRVAPLGSVVITTNLDVSRWRRPRRRGLRLGERAQQAVFWSALGLTLFMLIRAVGDPFGPATLEIYLAVLAILAVSSLFSVAVLRPAPDGVDDAGGPSVLLELMRRFASDPVPGVEVWLAFTGCGNAYQGGMNHFLDLHSESLREPVLVVALDKPERSPITAVVAEGPVIAQTHRATGPSLVERLRWAGVQLPEIRLFGVTDARAAQVRGVRSLALTGGDAPASAQATLRAADVVEVLVRWYAEDVAQVAGDRPALAELAKALEDMRDDAKKRRRRRGREPRDDGKQEAS